MRPVRVRFAPSPTGPLHIGGVRTALYNYLFARKNNGTFILRIEDTDQTRFVPGAEKYIRDSLAWLGITPDEGPDSEGPHKPYRQSERKAIYQEYAMRLVEQGNAYYAFDTEKELEDMRTRLRAAGVASPQYNHVTRNQMRNSLTLPADEVTELLNNNTPYVIRLKVPRKEEVRLNDLIRGWVMVHSSQIDDKVLMKSDGMPTYHLANVVDDYLMEISHVIRGEEWLPSAPLHVLLYTYLGWGDVMPQFAHLPLLLRPDGNGKLSKRDGDRMGFPVFPLDWIDPESGEKTSGFKQAGYLPEAVVNFLALLGWNPGTSQEIFSMDELIREFSIERIGKAGAKFDIQKAQWFNQQYLRNKGNEELAEYLIDSLQKENIKCTHETAIEIAALMKERATFPKDLFEQGNFFFRPPYSYDEGVVSKKWNTESAKVIEAFGNAVREHGPVIADDFKNLLEKAASASGTGVGKVMQVLRVVVTGVGAGPDLMKIMEIIGKEEVATRISAALEKLRKTSG